MTRAVAVPFLFLMACGGQAAPAPTSSPAPVAAVQEAPAPDEPATTCDGAALAVHKDDRGFVDFLHATVNVLDQDVAFLVDTGSEQTFAVTTSYGPQSAPAVIACRETSVPIEVRDAFTTTPDGRPQRGMLGADLLAHDAFLDLDLRAGALTWTGDAPKTPDGALVLPIEWRDGWLVVSGIHVFGRDTKLIVDTGSPHVLVIDHTTRDGEVRVEDTDGTGASVEYFTADSDVTLPGAGPRTVPVDRADQFATFERLNAQLGGDLDGLLGLSVLGDRRIVISKRSLVVAY